MRYRYFATVIVALAGCSSVEPTEDDVSVPSNGRWRLSGGNLQEISSEIGDWSLGMFGPDAHHAVIGDSSDQKVVVKDKPSVIETYDVVVLDIPTGRFVEGYPEPVEPLTFYVIVLEDGSGTIFNANIQSFDGRHFKVTSFGEVVDRRHDRPSGAVTTPRKWPVEAIRDEAISADAKMVMIPYPYPMNQTYYQYGDDIETARFVHTESGASFDGFADVLDSIEADWDSFR